MEGSCPGPGNKGDNNFRGKYFNISCCRCVTVMSVVFDTSS
jgi:hypothetical protein